MKQESRVSIVGTGPSCTLAPKEGLVWVTNAHGMQMAHCSMAFDMHDFRWTMEENIANYGHLKHLLTEEEILERATRRDKRFKTITEWANDTKVTVMSVEKYDFIPTSRKYPLESVIKKFGTNYFTSTIAYMLAWACYVGYKYIDVYGCDVDHAEEWAYQRPCITGWVMYARGMGRKVTVNGSHTRPLRASDGILYGYGIEQSEPPGNWYTQKVQLPGETEVHDAHIYKED